MTASRPRLFRRWGHACAGASLAVTAVGLAVLGGWVFDIAAVKSVLPGATPMMFNTALAFVLAGVSLWLGSRENGKHPVGVWSRRVGRACAIGVGVIGALVLSEYLFGWDLGIDELFVRDAGGAAVSHIPGRPSPMTALNFVLAGFALLFLDFETRSGHRPAQYLALAAALVAFHALLGYAYGVEQFYRILTYTGMAVHTTLAFLLLAVGIFAARPGRGLTALLVSEGAGAAVARWLLPAAVLVPLVFGWVRWMGEQAGLYGTRFGIALYTSSMVLVLVALIWLSAVALQRAEARVRKLSRAVEQTTDAVMITGLDGRIEYVNSAFQQLTGYQAREVLGENPRLLKSGTHPPEFYERMWATILAGNSWREVLVNRKKKGELYFAESSITPLLSPEQEITHFVSVQKDITERKRAEEERDRFFNLSLDLLCIAGFDGYFKRLNPAWEATLGWSVPELLSKPWLDFVHPDDRPATVEAGRRLIEEGKVVLEFENRYRTRSGDYRWLSWRCLPVPEAELIFATARDVTEQKKTEATLRAAKEEAERISRFKDQFLSTMSHELRTPLNAILGFSELLSDERYGTLTERQRRYLDHIHTGGGHLLRLINDILDLSRIEAGRMELAIESLRVDHAFGEVVSAVRPLAEKKSQSLGMEAHDGLVVHADATRLRQVLLNLVGNAIKFTPEGGRVTLAARAENGGVRIEVRDTGPGISAEDQQRIFEAFVRLAQAGGAKEGSGLGLAITKRLVELQGGELGIESTPGHGACFHFTLPAATGVPLPAVQEPGRRLPRTGPLIVIIEDDQVAAHIIESHLRAAGYRTQICTEPQCAVETVVEARPAAVTLDIIMQPVNGWEILVQLKNDARTACIPIAVVTILDQRGMGATLGADEFLVKPVEKGALIGAISRCLRKRGRQEMSGPVLVVEDDAPTREVLSDLLVEHGYAVAVAADGEEARRWVAATIPELVVLDLLLPKVSGFDLLAEWRGDPRTSSLPIFVLTGKDLSRAEHDFLRQHSEMLLSKKLSWQQDLLEQLRRAFAADRSPE